MNKYFLADTKNSANVSEENIAIGEGVKLACQARADTHPSSSERKQ